MNISWLLNYVQFDHSYFQCIEKKLAEKEIFTFSIIYIKVNFDRNISEWSCTIISVDMLTKNVYIEYQAVAEDFRYKIEKSVKWNSSLSWKHSIDHI